MPWLTLLKLREDWGFWGFYCWTYFTWGYFPLNNKNCFRLSLGKKSNGTMWGNSQYWRKTRESTFGKDKGSPVAYPVGISRSHWDPTIFGCCVFCPTCWCPRKRSGVPSWVFSHYFGEGKIKTSFLIDCATKPVSNGGQVLPKVKRRSCLVCKPPEIHYSLRGDVCHEAGSGPYRDGK